jgi:hypothetical protein
VHSGLYYLDGGVVTDIDGCVRRERYLWEAERAGIGSFAGAGDLEDRYHWKRHVWWSIIWSISPKSQVDVEEGCRMALEPAWLDSYRSTTYWPCCSVRRCAHATAYNDVLVGCKQYVMGGR